MLVILIQLPWTPARFCDCNPGSHEFQDVLHGSWTTCSLNVHVDSRELFPVKSRTIRNRVSADTPKSSRYTLITPIKKEQACLHQATKGAKPALLSSVSESAESQEHTFLEHLRFSACVAPRQAAAIGGRMGDGNKRNKVKKSIWQLLCGCSSPQTTD
ncbi:hypothetical protein BDA96_04G336500 [Sorghum bicolor]|uniref:Uncharacterized protein n=1 Tax=Sorghum bicolor TaxID=4558 RepID=A0A921R7D4_SORBI|nr:hypothetical protein BDA96_04G336500 [Sorghum bicolor]